MYVCVLLFFLKEKKKGLLLTFSFCVLGSTSFCRSTTAVTQHTAQDSSVGHYAHCFSFSVQEMLMDSSTSLLQSLPLHLYRAVRVG